MKKLKIKEIVVVEGKDDTRRLQEIFEVDTIETIGSAINHNIIEEIKHAQKVRGVIVFTDPDFAGEKIRKIIMKQVPEAKHAFLNQNEARPYSKSKGKSLGVEHASPEAIVAALKMVMTPENNQQLNNEITRKLLTDLNLLDGANSRQLRLAVSEKLRIGATNGKQLLKRLQMFNISTKKLIDTVHKIKKQNEST